MTLEYFNQATADEAKNQIAHCVALEAWAAALVAARPFASLDDLLRAGSELARRWDEQALSLALSAHPRIGENASGNSKEARLSRGEQQQVSREDSELRQALRAGNMAYEQRFAQVFLIRARGRSGEGILTELHRRLLNTPQQERQEALDQLREITLLRLKETFNEHD